ncbi:MAG: hypothetical protein M1816_001641 [Peltula sp. TS41687]|nr:MAG: hypothetical protein M1816_001641 [Peltula sp. TS41687]
MDSDSEYPEFLRDALTLDDSSIRQTADHDILDRWTVTSLCQNQLEWRLQEHNRLLGEQEDLFNGLGKTSTSDAAMGAATLISLSTAKIISVLETSKDLSGDIATLAKSLNWTSIASILRDPRLPYPLLRSFFTSLPAGASTDALDAARAAVDIDELVLANEKFIRSRGSDRNKDGKYLVRFEQPETLFQNARRDRPRDWLMINRNDPPKGGLELFDVCRPQLLYIQPDTNAFARTFHRITGNILQGLNWQNIFIAGGVVLTTLLHLEPARDTERLVQDGDIDVYLYGLNPAEANDKVKEIYRVWSQNLPSTNRQKLVVKNAKTITFLSDYPNRRIQIVLKLVVSPAAVLLSFDLDPCAMGFNGTEVLMLPRAARCLETGYTTFTMDLVWGHHLHDRWATQQTRLRVLKYADRGFGLRILPSYVRALEIHQKAKEPGLKTLKRVAYMACDFVHRKTFGVTDVPIVADGIFDDAVVREYVDARKRKRVRMDGKRALGHQVQAPSIDIRRLDSRYMSRNLPERYIRVGDFELWMRYHEAWRLDAVGEAILDRPYASSGTYERATYDDLLTYKWEEYFDTNRFSHDIEVHNMSLFEGLKHDICGILGIPHQRTGWRDYLTRRIRRTVYGSDIDSIFEKQITLPLLIPYDLEAYLEHQAEDVLSQAQLGCTISQDRLMIPVHQAGRGTHILPDLHDQTTASGNVRYWVIGNELMWQGIHRTLDEVVEILWTLFDWTRASRYLNDGGALPLPRLDQPSALIFIARCFPDRNTRSASKADESRTKSSPPTSVASARPGSFSEREACLFHQWVLHRHNPLAADSARNLALAGNGDVRELLVMGNVVQYPPPDELFWRDDEEVSES